MAIQSFSVGQVLTAAQVNALQANDYNQTVSNKTASYTLVAADKGTRITMSSTSATTITVNQSLFSAGDTLFIQNINTGVSTITAGTATVTTSASLALAQWEGGTLYFTSASAAIFFKSDGAAASSGRTLLSTTTLSGATTTISSISQDYEELYIEIANVNPGSNSSLRIAPNSVTDKGYTVSMSGGGVVVHESGYWKITEVWTMTAGNTNNIVTMYIHNYTSSTEFKTAESNCLFQALNQTGLRIIYSAHGFESTSAITSLQFSQSTGNQNGGTVRIYGVK